MKKRLLSALLALVMVLALLPMSVFAAGPEPTTEDPEKTEQTEQTPAATTPKTPDATTPTTLETPDATTPTTPETTTTTPGTTPTTPESLNAISPRSLSTANATHDGWAAVYVTRTLTTQEGDIGVDDLYKWYAHKKVNKSDTYETYVLIDSGFIYSNKYYSTLAALPTSVAGNLTQNITSIGNGQSGNIPTRVTSLTVEIYSGSLAIGGHANLTSLTVKNGKNDGTKPTVSLSGTGAKFTSLTLQNVDGTGITLDSTALNRSMSINLTDAVLGAVTLNGKGSETVNGRTTNFDKAQKITATRSTIGEIDLTGSGSTVKLTDCDVGTVAVPADITVHSNGSGNSSATNAAIFIDGNSTVGDIEIGALEAKKGYPTVTIGGTATVGSITEDTGNPSVDTATASITINGAGAHVATAAGESIEFNSANVTINAGNAGDITLKKGGKLHLNGTYITVGDLDLKGIAQLQVNGNYDANKADGVNNGAHNTVGGIKVEKNCTLTIPADPTNMFGSTTAADNDLDAYTKKNILGGTWKFELPQAALSTSLVYFLADFGTVTDAGNVSTADDEFTYYTAAQLGSALNKQIEHSTSVGLYVVGQDYVNNDIGQVRFMNGITPWGTLQVVKPMQITLPSMINNVQLSSWTDGRQTYKLPSVYTVPAVGNMKLNDNGVPYIELNASGGVNTGDVTKLTRVDADASDYVAGSVRASLSGTVISLSGAVNAGTSEIKLTLTTDAVEMKKDAASGATTDVPVKLEVDVIYFSGTNSLTFSNLDEPALDKGLTLETDSTGLGILRLSNGTKYTLNGSGLKVRSDIKVANYDNDAYGIAGYPYVEVSVNAPTIKTDADKQTIIGMFTGFDWANSPAMKQAINAALATIPQSQVDSWLAQVQREAWTKLNTGTYNAAANATESGYDEVWLVPYLQVNVTGYSINGTLTFTAVPSYRIEVRQSRTQGNAYDTVFFDAKKAPNNLTNPPESAKVIRTGTLGALTGNMGSTDDLTKGVTLKIEHNFGTGVYMHQDSTYAYAADGDSVYTITHAGNSLGTMIINKNEPLVKLYDGQTNGRPGNLLASYDTLQAAVDDAKDKQHINVDQNYRGSMSVNVTGTARKFTIQANGLNVVAANTTKGLVDLNSTGGLYTVQLNRDSTAVVNTTTATIAVAQVANGSAVVSATTAKSGTTITVTCTPASGYRTNSVSASAHMTATDRNNAVTVTKVSDNVYSFKVPEGADTITVTPSFVLNTTNPAAIPFTDVATNHWAYNSVKYVYDNGLMNGVNTTGTQFGGTQNLTRAMVVTILYRAAGSPYVGTANSFSDVANNTWYSQAVAWANQNKIVEGYTNGTFQPTWNITRQELATILYRYNTSYKGRATTGSTTLAGFPDQGNVSQWATAGMQWAVGNGIVNGITNGISTTLSPAGSATRYEAATMLMRYGQGMGL